MGCPEITEMDWAWLAGIIDGEGCIYIGKSPWYKLIVQVKSADQFMAKECYRVSGNTGSIRYGKRKDPKHTNTLTWTIQARKAKYVLEKILPYLKVKQDQAYGAIVFQSIQNSKQGRWCSEEQTAAKEYFYKFLKYAKERIKLPKGDVDYGVI